MSTYTNGPDLFQPNRANLLVMIGSRYKLNIAVTCDWETDFTGWVAEMEVRSSSALDSALLADLSAYVSVNSVASQVNIDIDADAPEIIDAEWIAGAFDIFMAPPGDPTRALRVLQGGIKLDTEVTR